MGGDESRVWFWYFVIMGFISSYIIWNAYVLIILLLAPLPVLVTM